MLPIIPDDIIFNHIISYSRIIDFLHWKRVSKKWYKTIGSLPLFKNNRYLWTWRFNQRNLYAIVRRNPQQRDVIDNIVKYNIPTFQIAEQTKKDHESRYLNPRTLCGKDWIEKGIYYEILEFDTVNNESVINYCDRCREDTVRYIIAYKYNRNGEKRTKMLRKERPCKCMGNT